MTSKELFEYLTKKINLTRADAYRVMWDARDKGWSKEQTIKYAKSLLNQ